MSMSHSHTSQHWTHLPRCEFIQLTMIGDEDQVRRGGPEEEMIRLAQLGKIETILGRKENIALNHLFEIPKHCDTPAALPSPPQRRRPLPPSPSSPQLQKQTSQAPLHVTCYGKRDHIPHFVKIEIISIQDRALKADYNGTFSLAMRCSVVML